MVRIWGLGTSEVLIDRLVGSRGWWGSEEVGVYWVVGVRGKGLGVG